MPAPPRRERRRRDGTGGRAAAAPGQRGRRQRCRQRAASAAEAALPAAPAPIGAGGTATGAGGIASGAGGPPAPVARAATGSDGRIKHVFVITMENEAAAAIYGSASAPYINGSSCRRSARANAFADPLPDAIPSEPHYVWMEAGTNQFSDATFTTDADPSASNSTASTAHLATQMDAASPPVSWLSYQEGLNASTGALPGAFVGLLRRQARSRTCSSRTSPAARRRRRARPAPRTTARTRAAGARAGSASGEPSRSTTSSRPTSATTCTATTGCPGSDDIRSGDDWLAAALPPLIDYANANDGVIFIVWDEPVGGSTLIPFVAIGPQVKPGYASSVRFTHSSLTKTVEEIFGLPILPTVASANDFSDLFLPGTF